MSFGNGKGVNVVVERDIRRSVDFTYGFTTVASLDVALVAIVGVVVQVDEDNDETLLACKCFAWLALVVALARGDVRVVVDDVVFNPTKLKISSSLSLSYRWRALRVALSLIDDREGVTFGSFAVALPAIVAEAWVFDVGKVIGVCDEKDCEAG